MAARTDLLTLVQQILRRMSSDPISELGETEEADQVQEIVGATFYDMLDQRDWGHKMALVNMTASGDNLQPTRMQLPENVMQVVSIRYDRRLEVGDNPLFQEVHYLCPEQFLNRSLALSPDADNIITVNDDVQALDFYVYNDRAPSYWTSFDDEYVWFDSYDVGIDSTLQSSKTLVRAELTPAFPTTAAGVPDVPNKDWMLFKNMCIARCFETIKQVQNPAASSFVRRFLIRSQRENSQRIARVNEGANYGRS